MAYGLKSNPFRSSLLGRNHAEIDGTRTDMSHREVQSDDTIFTGSRISLLSLPPEIRLRIYDYVFTSASKVTSDRDRMVWLTLGFDGSIYRGFSSMLKYDLSIMRTNRQVYDEISKHLLSDTKFTIELDSRQSIRSRDRSVGAIERIRFWPYVTRLQICAELDQHTIPRLQRLAKAIDGGRHLKELGVNLAGACRPTDTVYLDQTLAVLEGLCVNGSVKINLSHPADECDSRTSYERCCKLQATCEWLAKAIEDERLGRC